MNQSESFGVKITMTKQIWVMLSFLTLFFHTANSKESDINLDDMHELLDLFNIGFKVKREFQSGNGKLMIQFNAYTMNKNKQIKDKKAKVDDIFLINVVNKKIKRINFKHEQPMLLDLPTGRYCIGGVKLTSGRIIPFCKHAFFDVLKNHIEMAGVVTMGVYNTRSGKKDNISVFDVDKSLQFINRYVEVNGIQALIKYQDEVKDQYPKSFYVFQPYGKNSVFRLLDEHTLEKQDMASNQNTYSKHHQVTYTPEGMSFIKPSESITLKGKNGSYIGEVASSYKIGNYWFGVEERWFVKAVRNIQDINMNFNLFNRDYVMINPGFSYSEQDYLAKEANKISVKFKFVKHKPKYGLKVKGAHRAVNIEIPENVMTEKMKKRFVEDFQNLRFFLLNDANENDMYESLIDVSIKDEIASFAVSWKKL